MMTPSTVRSRSRSRQPWSPVSAATLRVAWPGTIGVVFVPGGAVFVEFVATDQEYGGGCEDGGEGHGVEDGGASEPMGDGNGDHGSGDVAGVIPALVFAQCAAERAVPDQS